MSTLARFGTVASTAESFGAFWSSDMRTLWFGVSPESAKEFDIDAAGRATGSACKMLDTGGRPRVVCGPNSELGESQMAAALAGTKSDLHVEIHSSRWESSLRSFSTLVASSGSTNAFLSSAEIGTTTLDLSLMETPELVTTVHLKGRGLYSTILDAKMAPPPPSFFRLPRDAEAAFFVHTPPAERQEIFKRVLLDEALKACRAEERSAVQKALEGLFFTGGDMVLAWGMDRARAEEGAQAALRASSKRPRAKMHEPIRTPTGAWLVLGLEEPAEKWLRELPALLEDAGCGNKRADPPGKHVKKRSRRRAAPQHLKLPRGSVELVPPAPGGEFLLIVPDRSDDHERTWISFGADEPVLADRLRAAISGAKDRTLASRSGIGEVRKPAAFGGFVTSAFFAMDPGTSSASDILAMRALPTGGRTPLVFLGETSGDARKGGVLRVRVSGSAAAVGDALTMLRLRHPGIGTEDADEDAP